jgi:glycosyltransferase involved in cell wall biosynthesis
MRILFVAATLDVQTMQWIKQLRHMNWDIHIFDPKHGLIHPDLTNVTIHTGWRKKKVPAGVTVHYHWPFLRGKFFMQRHLPTVWRRIVPESHIMLAKLIQKLQPDCIHSLGMQNYAYTTWEARKLLKQGTFPPWIYSSKGSDIYYWGQSAKHQKRIRNVLADSDYFICNCKRDVRLARQFGFEGVVLGLFQGMGSYPIQEMQSMRASDPVSTRKVIAVKGLQHHAGRALVALESLKQCSEMLPGYEVAVYQAHPETREAAYRLSQNLSVPVRIVPRSSPEKIWEMFGTARISIAVSISDGVPNAMIESMIMGAFPIQTDAGGATTEWIDDGVNGLIIPPDDPGTIAGAIKKALIDDTLVDTAAERNLQRAFDCIDVSVVRPRIVSLYQRVVGERKISA